jgi:hypothetical protein
MAVRFEERAVGFETLREVGCMKTMMFALGCLLVAVGSLALAAEPDAKSERFPKELEQLSWMVGDWAGDDDKAKVKIHCEWVKNNHFLQSTISAYTLGGLEFQGIQVIGWDPEAGQIRSWLFDSNGGFAGGLWQRANRQWVADSKFVRDDGARGSVTALCTLVDDQTFKWKFVNRNDKGATLFDIDEVTLHREATSKEPAKPATPPQ